MTPIMLDNRSRTTPGSATLRHRALPALYVTSVCRSMPARRGVARGGQGASAPPPAQRGQIFFGARWVRLRPTWYRLPPQAKNPSYAPGTSHHITSDWPTSVIIIAIGSCHLAVSHLITCSDVILHKVTDDIERQLRPHIPVANRSY